MRAVNKININIYMFCHDLILLGTRCQKCFEDNRNIMMRYIYNNLFFQKDDIYINICSKSLIRTKYVN